MANTLPLAARYRHVVFPEVPRGASGVLDYCPGDRPAPRPARTPAEPLGADEWAFLSWLFASAGLDVGRYKPETLARRLPACLRAARAADVLEARRTLQAAPHLRRAALAAVVIGVTAFFRDGAMFSAVAARVLTEFANRTGRPGRLRVWSPGCSDGAELYSVAILLDELGLLDRCELLGTDCRADAVERARAGAYDAHAVRCVPPDLLARHFTTDADRRTWRVSPRLRAAARWRTADVLNVCEPGVWDLVLCRNLAIYLQPEAAGELWRRLEAAVRPGGVLALGKAERPGSGRRFTPAGPCLFRRSGAADGDGMNGTVGTDRAGGTRSATSPNGANTGARHV